MSRKFAMGANFLPGREWELGKTVASVEYVHAGERILAEGKLSPETAQRLRDKIEMIKSEQYVLVRSTTDQEIVGEAL